MSLDFAVTAVASRTHSILWLAYIADSPFPYINNATCRLSLRGRCSGSVRVIDIIAENCRLLVVAEPVYRHGQISV
jgi:hypothetical protein